MQSHIIDRAEWITVKEASALTGFSEARIRRLVRDGEVESQKLAAARLVLKVSLVRHVAGSQQRSDSDGPARPARSGNGQGISKPLAGETHPNPAVTRSEEEQRARNEAAQALLDEWMAASPEQVEEQRETLEFLVNHLDDERVGYREIFPNKRSYLRQSRQEAM